MKRVRIEEFFKDFDKLRKGKVTVNQFKSILSMLNFYLTEDEFQALADKYESSDKMFLYNEFCSLVNSAFTTKGIDKDPTATVKPITSQDTYVARRKYLDITPEEQQAVSDII